MCLLSAVFFNVCPIFVDLLSQSQACTCSTSTSIVYSTVPIGEMFCHDLHRRYSSSIFSSACTCGTIRSTWTRSSSLSTIFRRVSMVGTWLRPNGSFLPLMMVGQHRAHRFFFPNLDRSGAQVHLRTLNYVDNYGLSRTMPPFMICGTLEMRSTSTAVDHLSTFHAHNECIAMRVSTYANSSEIELSSTPLFKHVNCLMICFDKRRYSWPMSIWMKIGEHCWSLFS